MSTKSSSKDRGLSSIAERQMRSWAHQLQTQQQSFKDQSGVKVAKLIHPYVALSREAGANGGELAKQVADKLGWKFLDRELLDCMAERYNLSRVTLDFVDETAASWFHEMFGKWLDEKLVSQAEYVHRLGRIVLLAAQSESTVFVGRGVQFMLPREPGLAVRILAPHKQRVAHIMETQDCSCREAEKHIEDTDRGRVRFVERYFHHDITNPHLYDLVINLHSITMDDAAELIAGQCKRRFGSLN